MSSFSSSWARAAATGAHRRHPLALAIGLIGATVQAQTLGVPAPSPTQQVVITGNPLGRNDTTQPSQVLSGEALVLRRAATLGETLDGLPGVSSTWFGPNSNRPTIRGLDGDRVRLLDNAGAVVDASNLSFDHAVALDPLVVERVEVLRGPASLLYGGNATGGVVNTLDNRIPRDTLQGLSGRAEGRVGGAGNERAASALLEGGQDGLNWHADAFARRTDDLKVPRFTPRSGDEVGSPSTRVQNSAAQAHGGAVGVSWADRDGHIGLSADTYHHDYGVTVEPDVTIEMQRQRLTLAGERRLHAGSFNLLEFQASHTRYQHQEVEGSGEVGTTFESTGQQLRLQARYGTADAGGVIGMQAEKLDFSALGEEAFVPDTHTRSAALFALQSLPWHVGGLRWEAGARLEQVRVESDGDGPDAQEPRFGAAQHRDFQPISLSLSALWPLGAGWTATGVLGRTQRAPAYYELYADGLHLATAAYEQGDPHLGLEQGTHLDVGLRWKSGENSLRAQLYTMRFSRYLSLEASGQTRTVEGEDGESAEVPEYLFQGVPARLWGLELEANQALLRQAGWQLDGRASLDLTRGENTTTGQPLPRIAPARLTLGLDARHGPGSFGLELRHAARQDRVPEGDIATAGYTLVNASLAWRSRWSQTDALWFMKLDNLGNTLAYSAGAIRTVRELSPLPGRSVSAGLRVQF